MANLIKIRRGLFKKLPKLQTGEMALTTDKGVVYIGNNDENIPLNPPPDAELSETSQNSIANDVVAKAIGDVNERVDTLFKSTNTVEYGMRWVDGASETAAERCIRKSGIIYVGEDTGLYFNVNADGSFDSAYDNLPIWGEMRRVTLKGQVMVEIPKYYICEEVVDGYHYIWVCKAKKKNYRCAAIFLQADGKTENDYYYIGAYESGNGSLGESKPNKKYSTEEKPYNTGYRLSEYRDAAQAIGAGWGITPIAEVCDFWQIIMPIEFGTRDVQSIAAGICSIVDGPFDEYYPDFGYKTGMCDIVPNLHGIAHTTDNSPDGESCNYNGQTGINCGANPFVYRGIENPYGCLEKWIDGLTFKDGVCYTTNDRTAFATGDVTGYTQLGYTYAEMGYVVKLGYDENVPFCRLPIETIQTSGIHYPDWWETPYSSGYSYASFGGYYDNDDGVGVWCVYANYLSSDRSSCVGSRLSYSPL